MAERDLTVRIGGNSQGLTQATAQAEQSMKGVGDGKSTGWTGKVNGAFMAMAAGAAAAAGAIAISFTKDAWGAGTEATDARANLVRTFGTLSDEFVEKGKRAAEKFALPAREYEGLVARLGDSLQTLGFSVGDSANMMDPLVERLSDLAARYGTDVPTALEAFGALLRGERDPIEKYGVAIKETDVQAEKAKEGMDGLTGAADKNATAQATVKLFMDQTNDSIGAQSDRANTAAGKMERLSAGTEDLKAKLGQLMQSGLVWFWDQVTSALSRVSSAMADNMRWLTALEEVFKNVWSLQLKLIGGVIDKVTTLGTAIWNATVWPLEKANELWDKLFGKAGKGNAGGILNLGRSAGATGASSSPASVVPLGAPTATASGGSSPVFNINVTAGVGDPAEIGRKVIDAIRAAERVQGNAWRTLKAS